MLAINLAGDSGSTFLRDDLRALIGIPIGGATIVFLCRDVLGNFFNGRTLRPEERTPDTVQAALTTSHRAAPLIGTNATAAV